MDIAASIQLGDLEIGSHNGIYIDIITQPIVNYSFTTSRQHRGPRAIPVFALSLIHPLRIHVSLERTWLCMENVKQLFQQNIPVVPPSIMIDASNAHTLRKGIRDLWLDSLG